MNDIELLKSLPHKSDVNRDDWDSVDPKLILVAKTCVSILKERGCPILFTSLIRPRVEGVSISDIHAQKRAFDLSVRGLSVDDLDELLNEVNALHAKTIGAVSSKDGIARALIYEHKAGVGPDPSAKDYVRENSASPHLHGQVRA